MAEEISAIPDAQGEPPPTLPLLSDSYCLSFLPPYPPLQTPFLPKSLSLDPSDTVSLE